MSINPIPVVTFGGATTPQAITDDTGRVLVDPYTPTLLDGIRFRWGRSGPWEQPPPAVVNLSLFDPDGGVLAQLRDNTIYTTELTVSFPVPAEVVHRPLTGSRYLFRGRVTGVSVNEMDLDTPMGRRHGWRIDLTAADPRQELRARRMWQTLPTSGIGRYYALVSAVAPYGISNGARTGGNLEREMWEMSTDGADVESLLAQYFASVGDQYQYNPDRQTMHALPVMRSFPGTWRNIGSNELVITGNESTYIPWNETWPGVWFDACQLEHTADAVTATQVDRLNGWKVRYGAGGSTTETERYDPPVPLATETIRTAEFRSWLAFPQDATPVAEGLRARGTSTARGPHHPPVAYRTDINGGFATWDHALAILRTHADEQIMTITGSPWTRITGYASGHAITGGDLTYARGHWTHRMNLVRVSHANGPQPRRWNTIGPPIRWASPDHPHPHRTVAWADMNTPSFNASYIDLTEQD